MIEKVRRSWGRALSFTPPRKPWRRPPIPHVGAVLAVSDSYSKNGSGKVYGEDR